MSDACTASVSGFISSTTTWIDCQSQTLGTGAWQALSLPGSTLSLVLTGFLTIFIALIGYNLLLGTQLTVRGTTLAFVKIGAVFALATSWPAYRTLVYDLVTDGPAQLVKEIGPQARVVGTDGTLLQRLELADQGLAQLAILGPGMPTAEQRAGVPPPPFGGFDAFALGGSRILFELSAIGGLAVVRVITALMLALGPFFIAFLMFDATRSLFEGWLRVLGGAALGAVGVTVALGMELALLEPWLSSALARRMAGEALPTISTELFVISCLFALLVAALLLGCVHLVRTFRLPLILRTHAFEPSAGERSASASARPTSLARDRSSQVERTRAAAIAAFVKETSHRESSGGAGGATIGAARLLQSGDRGGTEYGRHVPLGRTFNRKPGARVSARAGRRDIGA